MSLKTLRDIGMIADVLASQDHLIERELIKKEAIKWFLHFNKQIEDWTLEFDENESIPQERRRLMPYLMRAGNQAKMNFIELFFDLGLEDLK